MSAFGRPPSPPPTVPIAAPTEGDAEARRQGAIAVTAGNAAELLLCGHEALPALLTAIAGARRHVHLQAMVFHDDAAGRRIAEALIERAAAGVAVRVLFERFTTAIDDGPARVAELVARLQAGSVDVVDAGSLGLTDRDLSPDRMLSSLQAWEARPRQAPPDWLPVQPLLAARRARCLELLRGPATTTALRGVERLASVAGPARRFGTRQRYLRQLLPHNHRKLAIVDGRLGFCGGMNIGEHYLYPDAYDPDMPAEDEPGPARWRDAHARVEGPVVNRLQRLFLESWLCAGGFVQDLEGCFPEPETSGSARIWGLTADTGGADDIGAQLHRLLARARSIRLTNPYLCRLEVIGALLARARDGARVQLLLPDHHNDSRLHHLYGLGCQPWFDAAGVDVWSYRHHFTHAKVAVLGDSVALIGSYNFNNRSAGLDAECSLFVEDPTFVDVVARRVFEAPMAPGGAAALRDREEEALAPPDALRAAKAVFDLLPEVL